MSRAHRNRKSSPNEALSNNPAYLRSRSSKDSTSPPSRKRKHPHDEATHPERPRRTWQEPPSPPIASPVIPEDETVHLAEQVLQGLLQARSHTPSETASQMTRTDEWRPFRARQRDNWLLASPEMRDVMRELGYDFTTMEQFQAYTNDLLRYQRAVLVRAAQAEVDLKKAFWFQQKLESMRERWRRTE